MTESLSPLKRALLAIETLQAKVAELEGAAVAPIAIVGIGCRLPGGVDSLDAFANLLAAGTDAVRASPAGTRPGWPADSAGLPPAGYLDIDVGAFDAELFGISPREAASIDPQQRLTLECAWEALEDAAIASADLKETKTGVFVGITGNDYAQLQFRAANATTLLHSHFASGVGHSMASGRLSYLFGLQGPAISVDTACSSSLVAVHLACRSLRARESDVALAGGTNLILDPFVTLAFQRSRMLAPDGRCKTFDARADGFSRGEGCVVLVLKRLEDALRDRDPIRAVIRGTAVNQDGPSSGLTAPNGPAQEVVLRAALEDARLTPADIGYVEAHGTGTELGDPIEVQALAAAYGRDRSMENPLLIGSIKTNVGHLEAAAGAAGIAKVIVSLESGAIPPHLHFQRPNALIRWESLPVRVTRDAMSFPAAPDGLRRAGVSSFGFSGTNAHVILEQAPPRPSPTGRPARRFTVLPLSARNGGSLKGQAASFAAALDTGAHDLPSIAHTAAVGRTHLPHRLALVARTTPDAVAALRSFDSGAPSSALRAGRSPIDIPRPVFLFTGQGSQRVGMGLVLYDEEPVFRAVFDRCAKVLDGVFDAPFLDVVFGRVRDAEQRLQRTVFAQPALFVLEVALAELWKSWGVRPAMVIGHSVGEYAAAVVAGAMVLDDALHVIAARARLMDSLPPGGAMLSVPLAEADLISRIATEAGKVVIAAVNSPTNVVLSGDADAIDRIGAGLRRSGIEPTALRVSHAFHSHRLEPMLAEFGELSAKVRRTPPQIPLLSNLRGLPLTAEDLRDPDYWVKHARNPVRFHGAMRYALSRGHRLFLECGPTPTLCGFGAESATSGDALFVPSLRRDRDDAETVATAAATLYVNGVDLDWVARDAGRAVERTRAPTYAFQRDSLWVELDQGSAGEPSPARSREAHPLLGQRIRLPGADWHWERVLADATLPFIADHVVDGKIIVPATGYLELAFAAAQAGPGWRGAAIRDIAIHRPLVLAGTPRAVHVHLAAPVKDRARLSILSLGAGEDDFLLHAECDLELASSRVEAPVDIAAAAARCGDAIGAEAFYEDLERRGLTFGPAFRGVEGVRFGDGEAIGEIALPAALERDLGAYRIHPALLDAGIQVAGAAVRGSKDVRTADSAVFLPVTAERVWIAPGASVPRMSHARLERAAGQSSGSLIASIRMFDAAGELVVSIERLVFRRVDRSAAAAGAPDMTYVVDWIEAESARHQTRVGALDIEDLARRIEGEIPIVAERHELERYDALYADLTRLATEYFIAALRAIGWRPHVGDVVTAEALLASYKVLPRHRRLLGRMLEMLAEDGFLERTERGLRVLRVLPDVDPAVLAADMRRRHGAAVPEIEVTTACGAGLAGALVGAVDPLTLLFPNGDSALLTRLYRHTPLALGLNSLVMSVASEVRQATLSGDKLRVLEIGGGTGGTTAHVLEVLPAADVDYTFTDVGPLFVNRAREEFGARDGMRFATLDLDKDPAPQGFAAGGYDLVLASNVLHATRDVRAAVARVASLLAPHGMLCAVEAIHAERWHDATVGLLEGWWGFEDTDLRPFYPLLERDRWLSVLESAGLSSASPRADTLPDSVVGRQALLLARKPAHDNAVVAPSAAGTRWLVFANATGTANDLIRGLESAGAEVTRVELPMTNWDDANAYARDVDVSVRTALARAAPTDVAYLWGFGELVPANLSLEARITARGAGALQLVQNLAAMRGVPPRLSIVTRGGVLAGPSSPLHSEQSVLWGFARAVRAERPEINLRCLDLDASADAPALASAVAALLDPKLEPETALRAGTRYVARLEARQVPVRNDAEPPSRLVYGQAGVLDDLRFVPQPRRVPSEREIEIEIEAAGLNFRDVVHALGVRSDVQALGTECVGVVVAAGAAVEHLKIGDRVFAAAGAFGDYVTIAADLAVCVPSNLSIAAAATVPIAFLTAEYALVEIGGMTAGETVLVHAAAGGVGMAAVQLARAAGLRVLGTAGTERKRARVLALGADAVFDSRSTKFRDQVLAATGGRGVDLVLNSLAGDFIPASLQVLAEGGRLLEIGKTGTWTREQVAALPGLKHHVTYHAVDLSPRLRDQPHLIRPQLGKLAERLQSGELAPLPHRVVAMRRAIDAFRTMSAGRHVGKLVLVREGRPPVRADGTYLVTGGLSGLGLLVAERLAERGAGYLVLVGRNAPNADVERTLEYVRASGVGVSTVLADVGDGGDMLRVRDALDASPYPLRGVVHSAGALDDALLPEQSWQRFRNVFRAKVLGSADLVRMTEDDPLDFLVLFSSVASTFGSPGQANHSAANAFLDALAEERSEQGRPVLSIAWGAWSEIGAAARHGAAERVSRRGVRRIEPRAGLDVFERLAASMSGAVVACPIDWPAFFAGSASSERMFERFRGVATPVAGSSSGAAGHETIAHAVAKAAPRRRKQVLRQGVERCVTRILGLPAGRAPEARQALGEVGLDSLLAVELRNALANETGQTLPATLLFDFPTIDALVEHLASRLLGTTAEDESASNEPSPPPSARESGSISVLDFIEGLSDAEVAQRVKSEESGHV